MKENSNYQATPYKKKHGESGKEKLLSHRKKPPRTPMALGAISCNRLGVKGKKECRGGQDKRDTMEEKTELNK